MWKTPFFAGILLVALFFGLTVPTGAAPATSAYLLGTGDKLQIKLYEWRSADGQVQEWSALNGEFTVGPEGNLSLPLIGDVPAAGRTTDQLGKAISGALQTAVGLKKPPEASVQIVAYRPFYIVGNVEHPGAYPFQPGMTVLQAVSIAGGLFRRSADADDVRTLRFEYDSLQARRARLKAESDDAGKIDFPPDMLVRSGDPEIAQLMQSEQVVFTARQQALRAQVDGLGQERVLLDKEIGSLQAKIANADQELTMLKRELANAASLVGRGLEIAPREFNLRQTELEMEGRRLDLDGATLRARQDVVRTETKIADLRDKTRTQTLADQQQTDAELAKITGSLEYDALGEPAVGAEKRPPTYSIVRREGDDVHEIEASETTPVMPGDTIKVRRTIGGHAAGGAVELPGKPDSIVRVGVLSALSTVDRVVTTP